MLKKILFAVISLFLGAMFIFSAYTKLFPIEIFEFSFIEIKVANWTTAPFIARLFLALEFFLGILLLLNWNAGNRMLAKFTIMLLGVFTIYLIAIIFFQGNSGNCGCFGNYIKMTPLESIIKNIVLISLASVLLLQDRQDNLSSKKYIILSCAIASIATPFVVNPLSSGHPPHA
ncbi:MAG: MauE/DoxX family redox-associated membrane protein, partial [Bacteroidia bacterium]